MYQPQPHSYKFSILLSEIGQGIIKIPQFQREFVWSKEQSAKLKKQLHYLEIYVKIASEK